MVRVVVVVQDVDLVEAIDAQVGRTLDRAHIALVDGVDQLLAHFRLLLGGLPPRVLAHRLLLDNWNLICAVRIDLFVLFDGLVPLLPVLRRHTSE